MEAIPRFASLRASRLMVRSFRISWHLYTASFRVTVRDLFLTRPVFHFHFRLGGLRSASVLCVCVFNLCGTSIFFVWRLASSHQARLESISIISRYLLRAFFCTVFFFWFCAIIIFDHHFLDLLSIPSRWYRIANRPTTLIAGHDIRAHFTATTMSYVTVSTSIWAVAISHLHFDSHWAPALLRYIRSLGLHKHHLPISPFPTFSLCGIPGNFGTFSRRYSLHFAALHRLHHPHLIFILDLTCIAGTIFTCAAHFTTSLHFTFLAFSHAFLTISR